MPDQEEMNQQQELLRAHRRTLAHYLAQQAQLGSAFVPPGVTQGIHEARDQIQRHLPVQGNLDPLALLAGGAALDRAVDSILDMFSERPFIFNLGHGILPQTPIAHVERMLARIRRT